MQPVNCLTVGVLAENGACGEPPVAQMEDEPFFGLDDVVHGSRMSLDGKVEDAHLLLVGQHAESHQGPPAALLPRVEQVAGHFFQVEGHVGPDLDWNKCGQFGQSFGLSLALIDTDFGLPF